MIIGSDCLVFPEPYCTIPYIGEVSKLPYHGGPVYT